MKMSFITRIACILSVVTASGFVFTASAQHEKNDTLFTAAKAAQVSIVTNRNSINFSVWNIDGSADHYFYQSGLVGKKKQADQNRMYYYDASDILVTENDTHVTISFNSKDNTSVNYCYQIPDPQNRYLQSYVGRSSNDLSILLSRPTSPVKWLLITDGIGFGWVTPLKSSQPMDVSMWSSNEIVWNNIIGVMMSRGHHSLTAGLGIDWREFVTKGKSYFNKSDDGQIGMVNYEEGMDNCSSRIKIFSLQIPVMYGLSFGRHDDFGIKLGPVVNFNTGGNIKTTYKVGSRDYKVVTHHIRQRPVTVDVMGIVRYKMIGVYVRYAPMNVFRDSCGLEFGSLSTGLMISF